jgi:hypothetical protein
LRDGVVHTGRKIVKLIVGGVTLGLERYLGVGVKHKRVHGLSNYLILYIAIQL